MDSANSCKTTFYDDFSGCEITSDCMASISMHCPFKGLDFIALPVPVDAKEVSACVRICWVTELFMAHFCFDVLEVDWYKSKSKYSCTETPKTSIKSNLGANKELNAFNKTCILMSVGKICTFIQNT